jgi:hypothetical protein
MQPFLSVCRYSFAAPERLHQVRASDEVNLRTHLVEHHHYRMYMTSHGLLYYWQAKRLWEEGLQQEDAIFTAATRENYPTRCVAVA